MAIQTLDVDDLAARTGNIYETVAILSKRARQIASNEQTEIEEKLQYFEGFGPEMEDVHMQEEQAAASKEFEKRPEPTERAIKDFVDDELYFRHANEE
ncbi:DNA-directed RNA polymerase subunit omega [Salisaeta longa]|uniref:DNA-directed RNA polymerase subunit omega n=1 Tax=Salisaeta longa TaxID=503170 RepID=UPI0003B5CD03|nr:DNA-directed RNA polymerase subunit omega [Salisaeta longa]